MQTRRHLRRGRGGLSGLTMNACTDDPQQLILGVLPDAVRACCASGTHEPPPLLPDEQRCIAAFSQSRQRDFARGRMCARRALQQFGIHGHPILREPEGTPIWPAGLVGSITHCETLCAAAVAPRTTVASLGIDIEPITELDRETRDLVCAREELGFFSSMKGSRPGIEETLIFSAKESVYKCLFPLVRTFIEFYEVLIVVDAAKARFSVRPRTQHARIPELVVHLEGRFAFWNDHVVTGVSISAGNHLV